MALPDDQEVHDGAGGLDEFVVARRRALAASAGGQGKDGMPAPSRGDPLWGLALSGGGIRSATFCLGLVSGLARKGIFCRFDLLSTVSGGGYAGSAVGKLYGQGLDARAVETRLAAMGGTWFVWWLRATSRYLTPRGAKDLLHAAALYARNLLAVHLELGLAAVVVGALLALVNVGLWRILFEWVQANSDAVDVAAAVLRPWASGLWLALVVPMALSIPLASAYWTIPLKPDQDRDVLEVVLAALMLLVGVLGIVATWYWQQLWFRTGDGVLRATCGTVSTLLLLAAPGSLVAWLVRPRGAEHDPETVLAAQRNRLTKWLARCVHAALVLSLLGLLDRAAWFVAFGSSDYAPLLPLLLAVALGFARTLAARLPAQDSATAVTGRVGFKIAEVAGAVLFALLVTFWASLVYRATLVNLYGAPPVGDLLFGSAAKAILPFVLVPLAYMALTASNADFSNLSSLHMFYRARLTRSYLGASNGARFRGTGEQAARRPAVDPLSEVSAAYVPHAAAGKSVFEVDAGDSVRLKDYRPHEHGGPVHILNVTINQTSDPLGGLFNQDRKGEYLSITSDGVHRVGLGAWSRSASFQESDLPTWMAISGAAFSPGLGGQTSGGLAILLFMAGVRLGYWWDMRPRGSGLASRFAWSKYQLLGGEARARFGGTADRFWYLSDGGHFENTGAYALLRERARMIVVADAAADPEYKFEDLENLVRKARIDLGAEIHFVDFRSIAHDDFRYFGSLDHLSDAERDACMALATVAYSDGTSGWLVYVKPNLFRGLPVDLLNYGRDNPLFPQEPTTDQFFSESQWESYFKLGRELGLELDGGLLERIAAGQVEVLPKGTERGAATAAPAAAASVAKKAPAARRFSARTVSLAKSGLSLTALAGVMTAAYQVWDQYAENREGARGAYLAEVNAALALQNKFAAGRTEVLPDLTSKLASIANTYCRNGVSEIPAIPATAQMYADVSARCSTTPADQPPANHLPANPPLPPSASCAVLNEANARACMLGRQRRVDEPAYWGIDYADLPWARQRLAAISAEQDRLAAAAAAQPAGASPAPPAPLPSSMGAGGAGPAVAAATAAASAPPAESPASACNGKVVYLQIYSNSQLDQAARWSAKLREKGARVPAAENVVASARRDGRAPPRPVPAPTAIYHSEDEHACGTELMALDASVVPRRLPTGLTGMPGVVELWLPPPGVNARN